MALQEKALELITILGSKNGLERKESRKKLVKMGKQVVKFLEQEYENINEDKNETFRWELIKSLQQIGAPSSIPIFIKALEDEESDIRWLAAEGLINVGVDSIEPLLKELVKNSDSIFVCAGAHHVFHDFKKKRILPVGFPVDKLLSALKNPGWSGNVKTTAYEILEK